MRRVLVPLHATRQHLIVTRELTLDAQTPAGHPQKRVEPEDGSQNLGGKLRRPIAPSNVCELMGQDDPDAVGRPFLRGRRQHDLWSAPTPSDEQRGVSALKESDRARDSIGVAKL